MIHILGGPEPPHSFDKIENAHEFLRGLEQAGWLTYLMKGSVTYYAKAEWPVKFEPEKPWMNDTE